MLTEVELLSGRRRPAAGPFPAYSIQLDILAALKSSGEFLARPSLMGGINRLRSLPESEPIPSDSSVARYRFPPRVSLYQ